MVIFFRPLASLIAHCSRASRTAFLTNLSRTIFDILSGRGRALSSNACTVESIRQYMHCLKGLVLGRSRYQKLFSTNLLKTLFCWLANSALLVKLMDERR